MELVVTKAMEGMDEFEVYCKGWAKDFLIDWMSGWEKGES